MSVTGQEGAASDHAVEEDSSTSLIDLIPNPTPADANPHRHITTRHNRSGMAEFSSLLESLYLETPHEEQHPAEDSKDGEAVSFAQKLHDQQMKVGALENWLKEAVDSTLNCEEDLRIAKDAMAKEV